MKKGFTLIELLSVIIILAVITLIAVPVVSGIITKVRLNALKSSAYGLMEASDLYHAQYSNAKSVRFDIDKNKVSSNDTSNLLIYNGEVKEGTVIINKKGETSLCITDGKNSVYKNYNDKDVIAVSNKKCMIPSSTYVVYLDNEATLNEYSNEELTNLVNELKEEVNSLKSNLETVSTVAGSATLDKTYPVGSIYVSVSSTSPATLFGGTWVQIKDTFLLSAGDTYAAGSTGGSSSTTLSVANLPSHSHGLNSHTHSIPSLSGSATGGNHRHSISNGIFHSAPISSGSYHAVFEAGTHYTDYSGNLTMSVTTNASTTGVASGNTAETGSGTSFTNMPPYLSVYVWKRTA